MSHFQFKFAALLRYRKHQRDLCRQLLGQVLAEEDRIQQLIKQNVSEKDSVLDEVRQQTQHEQIQVRHVAARRFYAGQLTIQKAKLQQELAIVQQQAEHCRAALVEADQKVQALEKLEEKQRAEHSYVENRKSELQLEEAWMATQFNQ